MSLAYIIPGGLIDPPGAGVDLHKSYSAVRKAYADAAEWTGTPVDRFFSWELPAHLEYQEIGAIRKAAIVFGLCDLLAESGASPSVVAGLSFGNMLGACLAGAADRPGVFRFLAHQRGYPGPPGPPQGLAALHIAPGATVDQYMRQAPDGVYLAGDFGIIADSGISLYGIAGYHSALEEFARRQPNVVELLPGMTRAHHSPLNAHYRDFMMQGLEEIEFRDPILPLCSCIEQKTISTAAEARELFIQNPVRQVSIPYLTTEIEKYPVDIALIIGPAPRVEMWDIMPIPLVRVEQSDHVTDALTAVSEFGIFLSGAENRS